MTAEPYSLKTLMERVKYSREAANVHRVHGTPPPVPYQVGMHSFNMLSMLRIMWPDAPLRLVWAVLEHDMPERLTGDMSHPAKAMGLLNYDRQRYIEAYLNNEVFRGDSAADCTPEEIKWLKGLDMLEFYCWCKDQLMIGNRTVETQKRYVEKYMIRKQHEFPVVLIDLYYEIKESEWKTLPDMEDHG